MMKHDCLQAVLWDMDGVLIDSHYAHFLSFEKAFDKFGINFKEEEYAGMFGMANNRMIQRMTDTPLSDAMIEEIDREKDIFFRESCASEVRIIKGLSVGWTNSGRTVSAKRLPLPVLTKTCIRFWIRCIYYLILTPRPAEMNTLQNQNGCFSGSCPQIGRCAGKMSGDRGFAGRGAGGRSGGHVVRGYNHFLSLRTVNRGQYGD
jgi:hypothetical protein